VHKKKKEKCTLCDEKGYVIKQHRLFGFGNEFRCSCLSRTGEIGIVPQNSFPILFLSNK